MSIRARLILTLAAIACVLSLPAAYGLSRLATLRDIAHELRGQHAAAWVALSGLESGLQALDRQQRRFLAAPDSVTRAAMWRALADAHAQLDLLREADYGQEARAAAVGLAALEARTGEMEETLARAGVGAATDLFFAEIAPTAAVVRESLQQVAAGIDRRSAGAAERAREIGAAATRWVLAALLAALLLALLLGTLLTGTLVGPLRRLQGAMARVAQGDLEEPADLACSRRDELGELSRSFRSMTEQLGELTRQRAEFVSIVTHDLKTPINVVAGYAELLRESLWDELSTDDRDALDAITEQVETLLRQIQHLLDLSRLEAGAFHLASEPIYLADLCTGLRRAFEKPAAQKGIGFTLELDPSAPETIVGDMDRLRNEVLGNLLGNAFKFTGSRGTITVRMFGDADRVTIEIADTGIGIPTDELPHIFERYFQGRQGARSTGAGLGLAIAREVVQAHGGEIEACSRPGEGTTFRVRLPVRPTHSLDPSRFSAVSTETRPQPDVRVRPDTVALGNHLENTAYIQI